jgi:nucleoside-diphosphate-sugar epimerase
MEKYTQSDTVSGEDQLEELLSRPSDAAVDAICGTEGDFLFLGVNGKIGPSLAAMARRACDKAGITKRIIGVSKFQTNEVRTKLENQGIETIRGDLLDVEFLRSLPACRNVFFLAGMKFGSTGNPALTWAVNSFLPGLVADKFRQSRIVAYSTGCVYPLVTPESGGSLETGSPLPVGEYAQSCLGRERLFEYGSDRYGTPVSMIRLNYSVELRYGVLVDIARKVMHKEPIDLKTGYFNVIWQADANDMVLRSLGLASSPACVLNITGPEILSVREVALEFASLFNVEAIFVGEEAPTALLSNAAKAFRLLGHPVVPVKQVIRWTASWIQQNGTLLDKPTHFEVRDGKY